MSEITAASLEQSSGIEQVNQAVVQMDQVTQQNAALVEEAAAAAESLKEQAQGLSQAVSVFVLDGSGQSSAAPVARAADAGFVERRGPNRAKNVERLPAAKAAERAAAPKPAAESRRAASAGGNDEWKEF
jgi:uncharacterized phage infection (PIP) family protein YhgE